MSAHLHTHHPMRGRSQPRARASALDQRHVVTLALVALLAAALLLIARTATGAQVAITVNVAPPALPVYEQPPLPSPGYLWVPGYWSWGPEGYFWVPGTWVLPPDPDLVWTPGYWAFSDDAYVWNPGYWGPEVGFYGGVDYGFGYFGHGYEGGYWRDHAFWYNRSVNNVGSTNVTNVYQKTVNNVTVNNISYNGGPGGISARPTAAEQSAAREPRHAATREQTNHVGAARQNHELLASVNQGHPPIAATPQPNAYSDPNIKPARNAAQGGGSVRGAPPNAPHAPGASGASASTEPARPQTTEPPRRLAEAPPQSAPPPTHERPGPAERATPPPQSRAAPEIGPSERAQAERPETRPGPPPAERAPPPAERAPPHAQGAPAQPEHAPRPSQPQHPSEPREQRSREHPNGRPEDQPPH
ncbi:MAG TPA: hypothetical protein VI195_10695 [Steroidobacteraceae bacterium]